MAVPFTVTKKKLPNQTNPTIAYYPRVAKSGVMDLDDLSERISSSCSVTQSDCYAVVISLVNEIGTALEEGNIVRLGHLGSFQISVQSTASATPEEVDHSKIKRSSIVFRPGKKLKLMLQQLTFKKTNKSY
jgi:predicted histone-like DNA-binding protein